MSKYDYCRDCWCELPGFPETGDYEDIFCPDCRQHNPTDEELDIQHGMREAA